MNRHSFKWKILLLFSLLFLGANSFTFLLVRKITQHRYHQYLEQIDRRQAQDMADFLSRRWSEDLEIPQPRPYGPGRMGSSRANPRPVVIFDQQGQVLYNSRDGSREIGRRGDIPPGSDAGVPITVEGEIKGRILIGSMAAGTIQPEDSHFLRSLNIIYIFSSVFFTTLGLLLMLLLVNRLFAPIEKIEKATLDLSKGDYSIRTGLSGSDEIAHLGQSFDHMAQRLQNARLWKEQIISDAAHELRTPVSVIQGTLEMILEGIYNPSSKRIEQLYRESQALSRLIEDMQDLSSLESRQILLEKEDVNLAVFFQEVGESIKPLLAEKKLILSIHSQESPLVVSIDKGRIRQVLLNLLKNSLALSPECGKISLSFNSDKTGVTIMLDDQGPGIPEEERERVFERFYRIDRSRNREDGRRGLGLAISKAIIEAHGGTMGIEESSFGGARLWFQIPLL